MGLRDKLRSTSGSIRAFPTMGRRLFRAEQRQDLLEQELSRLTEIVAGQAVLISESSRRATALEHQTEQLHKTLGEADPGAILDIVTAVRDNVSQLTIEVSDQTNRNSALLAKLDGSR